MGALWAKFKYFDIPLLITSGLLLLIGLAVMYSTSLSGDTMQVFYKQTAYVAIGIAMFLGLAFYDYQRIAKINRYLYIGLILALTYLLIFGDPIRGSARWIDFGVFNFQPAEFAKLIVVTGLSRWLYLRRGQINSWSSIAITFLYAALPAFLILREPDLGSALVVMALWFGILLASPIKKSYLVVFVLIAAIVAGLGWEFFLHDYQKKRVEVFLDPNLDPRGKGYNVRQAIIAVGSGGWVGRGLGRGLQSQLKFLPERQTDFIFASAAEEIGFVGCGVLVALFILLMYRLIRIANYARDDLAKYMVTGILFLFFTQAFVNIGMNIGIMPVTGIPLPFLTYGGSSMIVSCIALGIVQNIARQSKTLRF
jgi:rod shape determining protein RodA